VRSARSIRRDTNPQAKSAAVTTRTTVLLMLPASPHPGLWVSVRWSPSLPLAEDAADHPKGMTGSTPRFAGVSSTDVAARGRWRPSPDADIEVLRR
jgi:hypothetical protein